MDRLELHRIDRTLGKTVRVCIDAQIDLHTCLTALSTIADPRAAIVRERLEELSTTLTTLLADVQATQTLSN